MRLIIVIRSRFQSPSQVVHHRVWLPRSQRHCGASRMDIGYVVKSDRFLQCMKLSMMHARRAHMHQVSIIVYPYAMLTKESSPSTACAGCNCACRITSRSCDSWPPLVLSSALIFLVITTVHAINGMVVQLSAAKSRHVDQPAVRRNDVSEADLHARCLT
jgi:hypothetical protein